MSTSTAYTPLESLLLFQALRNSSSIDSTSFARISDDLNSIPLVKNDPSYDAGRLSPDALRELYLWLLKEEVKLDLDRSLDGGVDAHTNGDTVSPGSRKRKAPSPSLPTVHEAAQHAHLIPRLVTRLYARYRENAVRQIREQERRHDNLVRETQEIEQGKWDERLQRQTNASKTSSPKPSTNAHAQPVTSVNDIVQQISKSTSGSPDNADGNAQQPKRYSQAKIDAIVNHDPEPPSNHSGGQHHRRSSSTATLPPLSEMAPHSPRFGVPPKIAPQQQQWPPGSGHGFAPSPTSSHGSPYAPHHAHPPPPMQSPRISHSISRPSSSPRPILPPPPGMVIPAGPPAYERGQVPPHAGSPGMRGPSMPHQQPYSPQQHPPQRTPTGPPPANDRRLGPYQQPPHMSTPPAYYQQPHTQQQQYPERRSSYTHQQPPAPQAGYSSHTQQQQTGGYMLPPFQVSPQDPLNAQPHQLPLGPQQQMHAQQQYGTQRMQHQHPQPIQQKPAPYPHHPSTYQQSANTPGPAPVRTPQQQPATVPAVRPVLNRHLTGEVLRHLGTPPRPAPLTPGGREQPIWKSERQTWPSNPPGSPPRPVAEPLSPTLQKSRPVARRSLSPSKDKRGKRAKRSTSTHVEDDARPGSGRMVKDEPATPANLEQSEPPELAVTSPAASRPMTRQRRGTLQSLSSSTAAPKRKASAADPDTRSSPYLASPAPPVVRHDKVLATRNFAKMSQVIMNDINSHKHGSRFAAPVRDRDATGYSEIIKRPQDLKSIRTALTAGSRAVASLETSTPGIAGGSGSGTADGTVELDKTEDLVPPKGIVNGAQLEKEVMRVFANAVMFNPGDDGMVADTREMFEDVEAKIREWRGAGVDSAPVPGSSVGGEEAEQEEEEQGRAKRSRKG